MSLTEADWFECPYCMATNDIEIDPLNDIAQIQIVDCQVCCQPIEVEIEETASGYRVAVKRDFD